MVEGLEDDVVGNGGIEYLTLRRLNLNTTRPTATVVEQLYPFNHMPGTISFAYSLF